MRSTCLLIVAAGMFAACGTPRRDLDGTGGDGSANADVRGDRPAVPSPYCPSVPPMVLSACTMIGRICTYGDDPRPPCRTRVQCDDQQWNVIPPTCGPMPTSCVGGGGQCQELGDICVDGTARCECFEYNWVCFPQPTDPRCPMVVPQLGGGCADMGLECNYGDTLGSHIRCNGGAWEQVASMM
jgi:hypothetical protein